MNNWKLDKLGNITQKIGSGATPRGGKNVYLDNGIPLIRSQNIYNDYFNYSGLAYLSVKSAKELDFVTVQKNDNLINITGDSVCRTNIVPNSLINSRVNQHVMIIRPKEEILDFRYLHYFLISPNTQKKLYSFADSGGTRKALTKEMISELEIPLPSLNIQQRIAEYLGSLDDKIELNRQMNQTLESMARAIFKSWFVDFDPVYAKMEGRDYPLPPDIMDLFPDELEESELGLIPKGWNVVEIKELGEVITGKTPSTKNKDYYDKREIPFIKIPDMHDKFFVTETNDYLSNSGADSQKNKYLPPKSICVSCIASPGLSVMTTSYSQTNQQINSIVPYEKEMAYFILLSMKRLGDEIQNRGSGGSVLHNLNKGDFEKLSVILPEDKIIKTIDNYLNPIFSRILSNQIMNSYLEQIRDNLLVSLLNFNNS